MLVELMGMGMGMVSLGVVGRGTHPSGDRCRGREEEDKCGDLHVDGLEESDVEVLEMFR